MYIMNKKLEVFTKCPRQRFPGDRKFKDDDNPMNNKTKEK